MAWNDSNELLVGGSGQVYVAPVGTALPTGPESALNAAFAGLGYHSEDGVSISNSPNIIDHPAWQARQPVRRDRDSEDFAVTFALLQWNEESVKLAFGGGSVDEVTGGYKYTPPSAGEALDERAVVVDVDDGDERARFVIPRGSAVEAVDSAFTRGSSANLPITIRALAPEEGDGAGWYALFSDEDAFAPGS